MISSSSFKQKINSTSVISTIKIIVWGTVTFVVASLLIEFLHHQLSELGWLGGLNIITLNLAASLISYILILVILTQLPKLLSNKTDWFKSLIGTRKDFALEGWLTWQHILLGIAGLVASMLLMMGILIFLSIVLPGLKLDNAQELGISAGDIYNRADLLLAFVMLVMLAPVAEELIFRGYLYSKLRMFVSLWPAVLVTSLLFGLAHGQLNVGIMTFAMSMVMCLLRESTGSIYPAIIVHMLKNGLAFYILFVVGASV